MITLLVMIIKNLKKKGDNFACSSDNKEKKIEKKGFCNHLDGEGRAGCFA